MPCTDHVAVFTRPMASIVGIDKLFNHKDSYCRLIPVYSELGGLVLSSLSILTPVAFNQEHVRDVGARALFDSVRLAAHTCCIQYTTRNFSKAANLAPEINGKLLAMIRATPLWSS